MCKQWNGNASLPISILHFGSTWLIWFQMSTAKKHLPQMNYTFSINHISFRWYLHEILDFKFLSWYWNKLTLEATGNVFYMWGQGFRWSVWLLRAECFCSLSSPIPMLKLNLQNSIRSWDFRRWVDHEVFKPNKWGLVPFFIRSMREPVSPYNPSTMGGFS